MKSILDSLNEEQRQAASTSSKYLQISAGPGTGKTLTLAARILNLQYNYDLTASDIIAISFSRTAKQQLTEKVKSYIEQLGYGSVTEVLTFHSLAHRIVRYGVHTNESTFKSHFQTINTESFIKVQPRILTGLCTDYTNRDLVGTALSKGLGLIRQGYHLDSSIYTHWSEVDPHAVYKVNVDSNERVLITGSDMIEFWQRVERLEKTKNIVDFQGLITEANKLLMKRSDTYSLIANGLKHILVDEYQDTSVSQERFLFSLASWDKGITVVGDRNQSIYTFNGSHPSNLERFYSHFKKVELEQTEKIHLQKNYRSVKGIVGLSNHFIGNNCIESKIDTTNNKPIIVNTHSITLAASYIASEIQELKHKQGKSYSDICILYRKNSHYSPQADEVIKELDNYGIPWGNENFFKGSEISSKEKILEICDEYPAVELEELITDFSSSYKWDEEVLGIIKDAMLQGAIDTDDLIDYLIDLDHLPEKDIEESVTLKTVHQAKGQEYAIVFILYISDRQFPHGSVPDIEEEKRLLYVGITRAMDHLYIIGEQGIQYENFLGNCMGSSEVEVVHYHTRYNYNGENVEDFDDDERSLISETSKALKTAEKNKIKHLVDMMEDW
ncbi:ATP-dependent helicase [Priestia megaterium]|uniref:ATP-dependent helicase n=1 Tax=Priestia megaterium TaxID=1404 RepID=UPI0015D4CA3A|nr:ATP-dependent helicase [Priestia megaterium]